MNPDPRLADLSLEEKRALLAKLLQDKSLRENTQRAEPEQAAPPYLTEAERRKLLVEWNDTRVEFPRVDSLQKWFELQVMRTPDAAAICFEDECLTYLELNERANRLAHYLSSLGVAPEVMVGIYLERSLEMVIAMLAVLKAGGGYVPLDPYFPRERLAFMLQDTQSPVILTRESLREGISQASAQIICLDSDWRLIAQCSNENPLAPSAPQNLAYVLYTSGSTGRPKGVMVEQRQVINYVHAFLRFTGLPAGLHAAMVQPLAVDSSMSVIFPIFVTGGCLHLISEARAADAYAFDEYLEKHSIDILKIAPSHLAALQNQTQPEKGLPRRYLFIGGEASRGEFFDKLQRRAPHLTIFNHYGPTETTVGVTVYRFTEVSELTGATVPIGRPLANVRAYILDAQMQPVPMGMTGELLIGGACVARGYLNRPDLTAEKFVGDPFSEEPDARLYHTGDLARYLPDGNIEYLGRMDHQIKIRGFRIEPGEIEAALVDHPAVAQVAVRSHETESGDVRLVGYVVAQSGQVPTASELRGFLKEKVASYMIPTVFMFLDELPRTRNGKLDLRALPIPGPARAETDRPIVAPRTVTEQQLLELWKEILLLDGFGIHDDFFELGGHSLLVTQVISRLREWFGVELPVRTLFEAPTIAEFAERIEAARTNGSAQEIEQSRGAAASELPPLVPLPREPDLTL